MKYSVSILLHTSPVDAPDAHQLWEERILLIFADDEEEANQKAEAIARKHEFNYENVEGNMLTVKFECIERTCLIDDELVDGCEIFSRFLRDSEARSLLEPFDENSEVSNNY